MRNAGFDTEISDSIVAAMWHKWIFIATLGVVTCLLHGTIGEINAVPDGEGTVLQALAECAEIAKAAGFPLPQPFLDLIRKYYTTKGSWLTSSMFRDMQKGADVEAEAILGDLLKHGQSHQLKTPLLQAASVRLRIYQNFRSTS
jgi:2-dehydropantoate 2-reductase